MSKPIPGWPEYQINEAGQITRVVPACGTRIGRPLLWQRLPSGYAKVSLCRNSKRHEYLVHRLVVETFIGQIPDGMDVCHNDGNKQNNHVSNLRIGTRRENMADTVRHGTSNRGERCGTNKYPATFIADLKRALLSGAHVPALNRKTGVPRSTLYGIRSGAIWGWL